MLKQFASAAAALAISGCGGYFDQHPANVRPESEAVAAVLGQPANRRVAESPPPVPATAQLAAPNAAAVAPPVQAPAGIAAAAPVVQAAPPAPVIAPAPAPVIAPAPAVAETDLASLPPPHVSSGAVPSTPPAEPAATVAAAPPVLPPPPVAAPNDAAPIVEAAPTPVPAAPEPQTTSETIGVVPKAAASLSASAVQPPAIVAPVRDAHCEAVAKQRADDAAAAGMDDETRQIVRNGTYANCVSWETAHGPAPR